MRKNLNLHTLESEPVQRLFNAIEPDSYVAPHRHLDPAGTETLIVVRGRFGVLQFDDAGRPVQVDVLQTGGPGFGIHIPAAVWHSVIALGTGAVLFEVKQGPYRPLAAEERAPWAPSEGTSEAATYRAWMRTQFDQRSA